MFISDLCGTEDEPLVRRQLLTEEERTALLGIPPIPTPWPGCSPRPAPTGVSWPSAAAMPTTLATPSSSPCCAIPGGPSPSSINRPTPFVTWMAAHFDIPAAAFEEYGLRPQTMTDHARQLAAALGLRAPTMADAPAMIEAAAEAARGTDSGRPIAAAVVAALRAGRIILPGSTVIERAAIAGRARARKRVAATLVAGPSAEHLAKLDRLLVIGL